MTDLRPLSGLPLRFDETTASLFSQEMVVPIPSYRTIREMAAVILEKGPSEPQKHLYAMYRDICRSGDKKILEEKGLRFDITVIPPGTIGKEYTKTAGHYHPLKPGTSITYPEVYEVLHGTAHYLLQKTDNKDYSTILDAMTLEVKAGEKAVIPPGYGHITINASSGPLVMSNWVEREFKSVYQPIVDQGGGAYFALAKGAGIEWIKNPRHKELPPIKMARPKPCPEFALEFGKPMYLSGVAAPEKLRFLTHPESIDWALKQLFEEIR